MQLNTEVTQATHPSLFPRRGLVISVESRERPNEWRCSLVANPRRAPVNAVPHTRVIIKVWPSNHLPKVLWYKSQRPDRGQGSAAGASSESSGETLTQHKYCTTELHNVATDLKEATQLLIE